jgi:hypothetical protein
MSQIIRTPGFTVLVCIALLALDTGLRAQEPARPTHTDPRVECLLAFERYAETTWHDCPTIAGSGYFGDGVSDGNAGIRGSCGITLAYATLVRLQPEAATEQRIGRVRAALLYAGSTHRTGDEVCVDGRRWGFGWQSALWTGSLGFAAALLQDRLPPELVDACRRVVAAEADRLVDVPPVSGYVADSKAEENAWNSNVLALAAAWMPDAPGADRWLRAAKSYLANTYTVADTRNDPLADWITTVTLHPDFTCENHGFFHPSYQMVSGMSKGDSWLMARVLEPAVAEELSPFAEHNVLPTWNCLSSVLLDSGELAYPSGLDWALHGYGQVSYLAWLGRHLGQAEARWAGTQLVRLVAARQRVNGDGRFTGRSVPNGFYREAVMARRVALAAWHHQVQPSVPPPPSRKPGPRLEHLPGAGLILHRHEHGFTSVSYGLRTMGLVVPSALPDAPFLTTPRYPGMFGAGPFGTASRTDLRRYESIPGGFRAELDLEHGPLARTRVLVESHGRATAVIEVPYHAVLAPATERGSEVFPLGIENHELTGGRRLLSWSGGRREVQAMSGGTLEPLGHWVCVDNRLGVVVGPADTGELEYRVAPGYNRSGAAEDTLVFVSSDPMAPRFAVFLPDVDERTVAEVSASARFETMPEAAVLNFRMPDDDAVRMSLPMPPVAETPTGTALVPDRVHASSASSNHPENLVCDQDPETFWVSSRTGEALPGHGPTSETPETISLEFERPTALRKVLILPRPQYGPKEIRVRVDDEVVFEGRMNHSATTVTLDPDRHAEVTTVTLELLSSFDPRYPASPRNVQVAEVVLIGEPRP